jgi:hypothetical protein
MVTGASNDEALARLRALSQAVLEHATGSYPAGLDIYAPVDMACELIRRETGIAIFGGAADDEGMTRLRYAYAELCAAWTTVRFWVDADARGLAMGGKRDRRRHFFTFVAKAYELSTGYYAGLTWTNYSESSDPFAGYFFAMAKIYSQLLPDDMRPGSNQALGKLLKGALSRQWPTRRALERRMPTSSIRARKPSARHRKTLK